MPRRRRPPRAGALTELPPLRIAAQIAILQALYYLVAVVLMLFTALVAGMPFSLDMVLGWQGVRGDTTRGWLMAFVWVFDGGFCMAVAIVVLIARSKLVPDFALTIHFLHLVFTGLYTRSLPANSMWWACMLSSSALAVALAMWGCQYRELQPVFFGGTRILGSGGGGGGAGASSSNNNNTSSDNSNSSNYNTTNNTGGEDGGPVDGDEEMGFSRGRGRGRGKDGAGEYEMVHMKQAGS